MRLIRKEAHRRVAFLIAESSMKRKVIGLGARMVGAVPVGRAMDNKKPVPGKIYLPDPDNDPLLIRGDGTNFETKDFQVGGQLVLPTVDKAAAFAEILKIVGPEEIRLRKRFSGSIAFNQLTGRARVLADGQKEDDLRKEFDGTPFKVTPKIDQSRVYNAVFQRLNERECVGIFPEGGSHDRTDLLPLKGEHIHVFNAIVDLGSWGGHNGFGVSRVKPRFGVDDCALWHELLSCSQIQVTMRSGIWRPCIGQARVCRIVPKRRAKGSHRKSPNRHTPSAPIGDGQCPRL
jgi:hypothetical protein